MLEEGAQRKEQVNSKDVDIELSESALEMAKVEAQRDVDEKAAAQAQAKCDADAQAKRDAEEKAAAHELNFIEQGQI